jgi:hypothetical protein
MEKKKKLNKEKIEKLANELKITFDDALFLLRQLKKEKN